MDRLSLMILASLMASGCAAQNSAVSSNDSAVAAHTECDAAGVQAYVGQNWSDTLDAELRRASTSQTLRLLKPGQVMTLELNPFRLNAVIDAQGVISSLYCA